MKVQMHTIFRWGDRIVNKYDLSDPETCKFLKKRIEELRNEKSKDVYYREWFRVEALTEDEVVAAL